MLLDAGKWPAWSPVTIFVALLGAAVTFAIYRWEVRNIQICKWLIARGAELEEKELGLLEGQFYKRVQEPRLLGQKMGKTEAERLLYTVIIAAWLLLPIVAAVSD